MNNLFIHVSHFIKYTSPLIRYGSHLVTVSSYRQNNFTAQLASEFLSGQADKSYWLGLKAHNNLQTNMLIGADEEQISQYFGHWATGHPNVENGKCVQAVVKVRKKSYFFVICSKIWSFSCNEIRLFYYFSC